MSLQVVILWEFYFIYVIVSVSKFPTMTMNYFYNQKNSINSKYKKMGKNYM